MPFMQLAVEGPAVEFGAPFKMMRSGMTYRGSGIAVIQWRMEPNTVYPAHNHPGYNGITVGIRGECRMRNNDYIASSLRAVPLRGLVRGQLGGFGDLARSHR